MTIAAVESAAEKTQTRKFAAVRRALPFAAVVSILVGSAALQWKTFESGFYAISADDAQRILRAVEWKETKWPLRATNWLPLHRVFGGIALEIHNDSFHAPRALSNLAGLLLVGVVGVLSWTLHRSGLIALYAMSLATLFGPRLAVSVAPTVEVLFALAILTGLIFLRLWLDRPKIRYLLGMCLAFSIGSGLRYEGWLFIPAVLALVGWRVVTTQAEERRIFLYQAIAATLLLAAFPVFWLILWYQQHGDPLGFLGVSGRGYRARVNPTNDFGKDWKYSAPGQFWRQNLESLNLIGLGALTMYALHRNAARSWSVFLVATFVVLASMSLLSIAVPTHTFWRVPLPWSLALIPFTAAAIDAMARGLGARTDAVRIAVAMPLLAVVALSFQHQAETLTRKSPFFKSDLSAARYIDQFLGGLPPEAKTRVFIQKHEWHWIHIMASTPYHERIIAGSIEDVCNGGVPNVEEMKKLNVGAVFMVPRKRMNFPANTDQYNTYSDGGWWLIVRTDPLAR